jgi:CubicO group peptidase (beta-lactamase class C family)
MASTAQESVIFEFNFTGSDLNTTEKVSTDSVFRIGSISKLFTVYAFLLHGGLELLERSVTEFVPELRDISRDDGCFSDLDIVRWEEVTLGSLASHMSGIGRDCENLLDQGGRNVADA